VEKLNDKTPKMALVYQEAIKFLWEVMPEELSQEELIRYFDIAKTFKSKEEILFRLLITLQNRQMATKVIGFENKDKQPIFKKILFNYNANTILENYTDTKLFECFCENFSIKNAESRNNLWRLYSKSIISACKFLNEFDSADDFDRFVMQFTYNAFSASALPMLLEREVFGLGFPLACDWLKELGYTGYPKPDVHIKDIFYELDLCDNNDYSAYKAVIEMANVVEATPYKVDKIFYLIGSGNFYIHNIKIGRNKAEFIKRTKDLIISSEV